MALPTVSIIGQPNVGKSSLLNRMAGQMISIVEPTAGVTRDRVSALIESEDRYFELVDTGGYGIVDSDELTEHVNAQINQAIEKADLVLFIVDIRQGVTPLDKTIAKLLRRNELNVMLVANKADSPEKFSNAADFTSLGFGYPLCVSATNSLNTSLLRDKVVNALEHLPKGGYRKESMRLAIVGKRNAGKSTLINAISGEERVIVSEVPGTTRDAVDVRFEKDGQTFVAIDTAGVRKKSRMANDIEFYSYTRATRSVKRADVVLFVIDCSLEISQVDKKLAKFISEEYKACILVLNKWDLVKDRADFDDFREYLDAVLPGLRHAPIAFTTATEGRNVQSVLDLCAEIYKQASARISTPELNRAVEEITKERVATAKKVHGRPKIYYATQVASLPITLLFFVNDPRFFDTNYQRFMINRLRDHLPVEEVPIRLLFRSRRSQDK